MPDPEPQVGPCPTVLVTAASGYIGSHVVPALAAAGYPVRVSARNPARLVCAVPVAAPDSVERVRAYADDVVALATPAWFSAVSQFYASFPQVSDEEVVALLRAPA